MKFKLHSKYLAIFLLLAFATVVVVMAQRGTGFFKHGPATEEITETKTNNSTEDTGTPTDDDPWQEMDNLVKNYYSNDGISYKGKVNVIDENGDAEKVIEQHSFTYETVGTSFYYQLGSMEVVNKKDMILLADHANKIVSISPVESQAPQKKFFDMAAFKQMLQERKANARVSQAGSLKLLTIDHIEDPQIQGYRVYYDPVSYKVSKMLIGMVRLSPLDNGEENNVETVKTDAAEDNGEPGEVNAYVYYVEIIYDDMKAMHLTEAGFKPEKKFITTSNESTMLMPAFSDYELLDNREQLKMKQ